MEQAQRFHQSKIVSIVTIIGNVILSASKIAVGFISGSVAIISDGVNSLSDVFTSFILLWGMSLASKKADDDHPYGHEKYEPIVGIVLATMIAVVAIYIGYEGVRKLMHPTAVQIGALAFGVTIASIMVKEGLYWYTYSVAKRIKSTALMATAWDHRSDSLSSFSVLIGLAGAKMGVPQLEPLAAIVVSLIILKVAYDVFKASADQIIDKSVSPEVEAEIEKLACAVDGVEKLDSLKTRIHANKIYVDVEISVRGDMQLEEAHSISEEVHDAVENNVDGVKHCMVHVNSIK